MSSSERRKWDYSSLNPCTRNNLRFSWAVCAGRPIDHLREKANECMLLAQLCLGCGAVVMDG